MLGASYEQRIYILVVGGGDCVFSKRSKGELKSYNSLMASSSLFFSSSLTSHSNLTDLNVSVSIHAFNFDCFVFFPLVFFFWLPYSACLLTKSGGKEERKFGTPFVRFSGNGYSSLCFFFFFLLVNKRGRESVLMASKVVLG